jgi:hypothetical protein
MFYVVQAEDPTEDNQTTQKRRKSSRKSASACLECVVISYVGFSMAAMCPGKKCEALSEIAGVSFSIMKLRTMGIQGLPYTLSPFTLSRLLCPLVTLYPVTLSPITLSPGHFVPRSLCPRSLCPQSLCPLYSIFGMT